MRSGQITNHTAMFPQTGTKPLYLPHISDILRAVSLERWRCRFSRDKVSNHKMVAIFRHQLFLEDVSEFSDFLPQESEPDYQDVTGMTEPAENRTFTKDWIISVRNE